MTHYLDTNYIFDPKIYKFPSVDEEILIIKRRLVYLETPECRQTMDKNMIQLSIKYATDQFRKLLKKKEYSNSKSNLYIKIPPQDDDMEIIYC